MGLSPLDLSRGRVVYRFLVKADPEGGISLHDLCAAADLTVPQVLRAISTCRQKGVVIVAVMGPRGSGEPTLFRLMRKDA